MDCGACGRRHGPADRVCLTCGEPLGKARGAAGARRRPAARAERRPMTALFCDLVNSVGLSERLDPEDLMEVYALYRACCEEVIARHGGYLAQYLGDGILAFFGYPRADEDDAAHAVRAGLELVRRVAALQTGLDPPLAARVGVATGLVVVTDPVGQGAGASPGIVGKMPNLAARLQSLAAPGSAVISEPTRRVARGQFTYRDMGAVALKGFTRPVQAWEAMAPSAAESRFEAHVQGVTSPFVGRGREMETLRGAWSAARQGAGRVVVVVGEPGIGKSRLIEAFSADIAAERPVRLRWFCSPQHVESPLFPVIDQLERAAAIEPLDAPEARLGKLRRLLGDLDETTLATFADLVAAPLAAAPALEAITPERRRELATSALLAMLARLSEDGPIVLLVEDVHWIDASSLDLLGRLAAQVADRRILVLVTARPEFRLRWTDLPHLSVIRLEPLDGASAAQLCAHLAGEALPAGVRRQILARGEGNPLFVEELTRTVVESLTAGEDGAEPRDDSAIVIPHTLHDSLVARLDRLGPARHVANVGSVIGRRFDHRLLAEVAARPAAELRSALRRLIQAGLVSELGGPANPGYLFRHALIRDAAYDSLLRSDRQKLHLEIAQAMLGKIPQLAEASPEVAAYHLAQGGEEARAIPYWETAGRRAAARAAHEEAIGHYGAALEAVRKQPESPERDARELGLQIPLARSLASTHGYVAEGFHEVLIRSRALCDRLGDASDVYSVLRGLCTYSIVRCDLREAEALAERCLNIGALTGEPAQLIEGDTAMGYVRYGLGEFGAARAHFERALGMYEAVRGRALSFAAEQDPRIACGSMLAFVHFFTGDLAAAAEVSAETLAWARSLGRPFELAYALPYASNSASLRGDFGLAETLAREGVALSETHGFRSWLFTSQMNLACAIGLAGRTAEAIALLEPTLGAWLQEGQRYQTAIIMGQLAAFYLAAQRVEEAQATIDAAITHALTHEDRSFLAGLHMTRAGIRAKTSGADPGGVLEDLRASVAVARDQGAATLQAMAEARLARLEARLGA